MLKNIFKYFFNIFQIKLKKYKTSENEQSHGSFFLRIGGLGEIIIISRYHPHHHRHHHHHHHHHLLPMEPPGSQGDCYSTHHCHQHLNHHQHHVKGVAAGSTRARRSTRVQADLNFHGPDKYDTVLIVLIVIN